MEASEPLEWVAHQHGSKGQIHHLEGDGLHRETVPAFDQLATPMEGLPSDPGTRLQAASLSIEVGQQFVLLPPALVGVALVGGERHEELPHHGG
jgi:hypothetical protein